MLVALFACGFGPPEVPLGPPPERLSAWNLVRLDEGALEYADEVVPFTLNTPLFSDYALKDRAMYLPSAAGWRDDGVFDFPVGTALLKTFSFAPDLRAPDVDRAPVETRVLVRTEAGWSPWPYVWDGDDAYLTVEGEVIDVTTVSPTGEDLTFAYLVPQRNQCADCHELDHPEFGRGVMPVGPTARNLHRDGQLDALVARGWLDGAPDLGAVGAATDWASVDAAAITGDALDAAARDYLDVNCASCHNPNGVNGKTSQLFLNWDNPDPFHLGVCKKPGSAAKGTGGRTYDIVPGDADASILHYRIATDEVGAMMPDIGRSVVHAEGVALIARWIDAMPPTACE